MLAGLAIAQAVGVPQWDKLDQQRLLPAAAEAGVLFSTHGVCGNFTTASGAHSATLRGYEPSPDGSGSLVDVRLPELGDRHDR